MNKSPSSIKTFFFLAILICSSTNIFGNDTEKPSSQESYVRELEELGDGAVQVGSALGFNFIAFELVKRISYNKNNVPQNFLLAYTTYLTFLYSQYKLPQWVDTYILGKKTQRTLEENNTRFGLSFLPIPAYFGRFAPAVSAYIGERLIHIRKNSNEYKDKAIEIKKGIKHYATHIITGSLSYLTLAAAAIGGGTIGEMAHRGINSSVLKDPLVGGGVFIGTLAGLYCMYKTPEWTDKYILKLPYERTENGTAFLHKWLVAGPIGICTGEYCTPYTEKHLPQAQVDQ